MQTTLSDIWKGKITSSGVVYNSHKKGKLAECVLGICYSIAVVSVPLLTS